MKTRLIPDLSFADYLRDSSYGSSDLRAFRQGPPAMVPWRRQNRDADTPSTRVGTAAHCRILTPELFSVIYAVKPEGMTFASKAGKEWRDAQDGKDILTWDEAQQVDGVCLSFSRKHAAVDSLINSIGRESSIFWNCAKTNLPCKARPDWFDAHAVYELKVSIVAERGDSERISFGAHREGWMHQLAHNRAALNAVGYTDVKVGRIVIVAPNPPHVVWLLEVSENDMDFLEMDNTNTRLGMAECHRTGQWPGTPDSWRLIELPASAAFTESDLEGATEILMP